MNIQTNRLTVTDVANVDKLNIDLRGMLSAKSVMFAQGAIISDGADIDLDCVLDTDEIIAGDSGNILADCNITVDTLKTNYLGPYSSSGTCVNFHGAVVVDSIKEKNIADAVTIDSTLVKDGEFYVNGTDKVETQNNKNLCNGYAGLDANSKVPLGIVRLIGEWNASNNTPFLSSGVGTLGDIRIVTTGGEGWNVGDYIVYNGTEWVQLNNVAKVQSVNGQTGSVNLTTSDVTEGSNLYLTSDRINNHADVSANYQHVSTVSGNVHNLTAAQVGNNVAQWNADKIQGRNVSTNTPLAGQHLAWNRDASEWQPVTLPDAVCPPKLTLDTGVLKGLINVTGIAMPINGAAWTFPACGNYRITWGAVCDYTVAAENTGKLILNINGNGVSIIDLNTYGGQHCECRSVWFQNVPAGAVGKLLASNTSGNTMTLSGCFVSIDSW